MKILHINGRELMHTLQQAEMCITKNHTLQILRAASLSILNGIIEISATDLNNAISLSLIIANKTENGLIVFEPKPLIQFLQTLDESETISLEKNNNSLVCISGRKKISLNVFEDEEYPLIPKNKGENFIISSEILLQGLESVVHAVSQNQVKPEINCVKIFSLEDKLIFVATDTFRLAEKKINFISESTIDIQIPEKSVIQIINLLKDFPGMVSVTYNENQVSFSTPHFYFISRVVDNKFPNYQQIIPIQNENTHVFSVSTSEFLKSLKTAINFSDETHTISIKVQGNLIELYSENKNIGSYTTTIPIKEDIQDLSLKCNSKYLIDALSKVHSDITTVSMVSPNKPFIIKPQGDTLTTYLIMPMNK